MDVKEFSMLREDAKDKWKEYLEACKGNPKDKYLEDMKKVYNQLKQGRKLIDITEVLKRAGINEDNTPKMAICQSDAKICYCKHYDNGKMVFTNRLPEYFWQDDIKADIKISTLIKPAERNTLLKTLVPPVPPSLRPKSDLSNYYTLWEVDKWELIPPKDPYILKRLTNNMFVVLGAWDLTELERAVIKGRVH